ncbi:hypothetical protein L210DRAFT_3512485 [Boletus edulis BED1]|uniref:Uncharacterized protein n=1 Tax=Boletus edulis BED1 TaxID=1328754 RepID=A0AAD4BAZ9_BOLED|nr:hypothetical protein L210DRAFT_3512485 [Boletus edulis BED1]
MPPGSRDRRERAGIVNLQSELLDAVDGVTFIDPFLGWAYVAAAGVVFDLMRGLKGIGKRRSRLPEAQQQAVSAAGRGACFLFLHLGLTPVKDALLRVSARLRTSLSQCISIHTSASHSSNTPQHDPGMDEGMPHRNPYREASS